MMGVMLKGETPPRFGWVTNPGAGLLDATVTASADCRTLTFDMGPYLGQLLMTRR